MEKLSDIDAKILKYIDQQGSATIDSIKKKFPNISAIEYRIKLLATSEYKYVPNAPISIPKRNSSYLRERTETKKDEHFRSLIVPLGIYELTDLGKKELQNYLQNKASEQKEFWLKNIWIPIVVSLITTATANYILPKMPQILQWIANTLLKIAS